MMSLLALRGETPGSIDEIVLMFLSAFVFGCFLLVCKGIWWVFTHEPKQKEAPEATRMRDQARRYRAMHPNGTSEEWVAWRLADDKERPA